MLRVLTLMVVNIGALLGGLHRVVLHSLLERISSFFLVRLRMQVRLDRVVMRYSELALLYSASRLLAIRHLIRSLGSHAPFRHGLGCHAPFRHRRQTIKRMS